MDPKYVGSKAAHRDNTQQVGGNSIVKACSGAV